MDSPITLPVLDAVEVRVLGSLMEKSKTTPDYYPMTINAITLACNQKTSRRPVVNYDEDTVAQALNTLKRRGLVSTATGGSNRVVKYKHNFAIVYPVLPAEVAIICLFMLRGPQTPGEINTNSGRMYEFESIEEVQEKLERLSSPELPFLMELPKRPGQKEARYAHLFSGVPEFTDDDFNDDASIGRAGLEARVTKLETDLAELREAFDKLMKELS
ncbi:YceH family protein [Mucilaginibacter sp. L3T2-6]|uniref:YceH family protein n=1 Tax=Mucilaginibacter sp. L3T2-6 TaxID=3062491 RepID=UPI002675E3E3|nr:YceH family protein [Mucilaginibacter sp. L3T2-6]MDO3642358.1 YceH family protein [Mucilaginibacter sp. L3T2-6]MDV6214853.1 YceH family protein [Mucilaginibacter sp. L3T2-6]